VRGRGGRRLGKNISTSSIHHAGAVAGPLFQPHTNRPPQLLKPPKPTAPNRQEGGESITVDGRPVPLGIPGADSMRQLALMAAPLGRIGSARDAAGAILFLASEWSEFVTGQVLEVNGGTFM
jgi:NAD(P)-dependent dehydrogenase (short-subunit alcohol dehydrogenase family)